MRLLDTTHARLRDFNGPDTPPYAILSHRWGDEEVILQDIMSLRGEWTALAGRKDGSTPVTSKKGFPKLAKAVGLARRNGFDFIWVDTCCIDKSSSAELSEAINSMYHWYEEADVCYAFLYDVPAAFEDDMYAPESGFRKSSWFKRGWTLQELIAPSEVEFFASDWSYLGNKRETNNFTVLLSQITGVPNGILLGEMHPSEASVASRMKWASSRETMRLEDIAYCLLGIFDVNMPLLYGEGEKAFIRLQEQILSHTDDETLFAWFLDEAPDVHALFGLLAAHPSYFRNSGELESVSRMTLGEPWGMTSKGLKADFTLQKVFSFSEADHYVVLNCMTQDKSNRESPIIYLKRIWVDEFARVNPHKKSYRQLQHTSAGSSLETIYIKQKPSHNSRSFQIIADPASSLALRQGNWEVSYHALNRIRKPEWTVRDVHPRSRWDGSSIHLAPSDFRLAEALALIRIDIEEFGNVDVAVGVQVVNKRQLKSWCLQLRATSTSWQVEDNFWVLNQMLRRGDILKLGSVSTEDIHGKQMPASISVTETHGTRTVGLTLVIQNNPVASDAAAVVADETSPITAPLEYTLENSSGCLEVASSRVMPVTVREIQLKTRQPAPVGLIHLEPAKGMRRLIELYLGTTRYPSSLKDWESCVDHGQELHEIAKSLAVPPVNPSSFYHLCHSGLVDDATFDASRGRRGFDYDPVIGFTPLQWAAAGGQNKTVQLLLRHQPRGIMDLSAGHFSVFHVVASLGQWPACNMLVDHVIREDTELSVEVDRAVRVNAMTGYSSITHDTPLHLAAAFCDELGFWDNLSINAWNYMVGFTRNPANAWGATPLHVAALTGNLAGTIALLSRPVDRTESNSNLQRVDDSDRELRTATFSLRAGTMDDMGRTCAWYAAFSGSDEIIKRLQNYSAPLDLADHDGVTPVHIACYMGYPTTLMTLLYCGASANAATSELCLLPMHIAAMYGRLSCLEVLLSRNEAAVEWDREEDQDLPPYTAITLALANGHLDCAQLLWLRDPRPFSGVLPCVVVHDKGVASIEDFNFRIQEDSFHAERVPGAVNDQSPYPEPRSDGDEHQLEQGHENGQRHRLSRSWLPWSSSSKRK